MADLPRRKFEVGDEITDTVNKRKGVVIAWAISEERNVWQYQCRYEWWTRDDIDSLPIAWVQLGPTKLEVTDEDDLRGVEKFRILDTVIHVGKGKKGRVQDIGWKDVAKVYVYKCLWESTTDEFKGLETTWTGLPDLLIAYPEEHELQGDF